MDLLDLSPSLILSIGLDAVTEIPKGQCPSTYMALFSFTHLAYAAFVTIAVKKDIKDVDVEKLFLDAMVLGERLACGEQRQTYGEIARAIWKPASLVNLGERLDVSEPHVDISKNGLAMVCKQFLDGKRRISIAILI